MSKTGFVSKEESFVSFWWVELSAEEAQRGPETT